MKPDTFDFKPFPICFPSELCNLSSTLCFYFYVFYFYFYFYLYFLIFNLFLIFLFIFWIRTLTPHSHLWDNTEHVKKVIWRDGEYTNNILGRNKFIMTA